MMTIKITDELTTSELKKQFSIVYPFLKIEFFNHEHGFGEGSPKHCLIEKNLKITNLLTKKGVSEIAIKPEMQIGEIEKNFKDLLGISIQIFRKSGDVWLETSSTDSWTILEHQKLAKEKLTSKIKYYE